VVATIAAAVVFGCSSKSSSDGGEDGAMVAEVDAILDGMVFFSQARVLRCDIVIEVVHDRRGTVDTALGGGAIIGRVSRKVTLDYTARP
jgi:hypothetical protein